MIGRCGTVPTMVLALSNAVKIDIGLIGVFFVLFPVIVQGLIAFAGAGAYAEKRENDRYLERAPDPGQRRLGGR